MNIFALDTSPRIAAKYHCDKHVVKMILETCQLLSTAWHMTAPKNKLHELIATKQLYKCTHVNHPCAKWVRQANGNYSWAVNLLDELFSEYTVRYGKQHASGRLWNTLRNPPDGIAEGSTPLIYCGPDQYRSDDVVDSYRRFYREDKVRFAQWKTQTPEWW